MRRPIVLASWDLRLMERFPIYFRSNLRITRETRLKAAVLLAVLFIFLMLAYWALDLGAILPRRPPYH